MTENHTERAGTAARGSVAGPTVVVLRGEIDLGTATSLTTRLDALTSAPSPDLVLDLREVTFIDCAGLGVLCRARNRARARAGRLRLVSDSARFRRMLRLVDLGGVFEVASRLPDVLSRPVDAASEAGAGAGARVALR
ncbi:STAS domain-containing protein [Streptomyces sp. NPDC046928]|uniref:STAS domain-containing protein n=1 Tax=Streptomyces sp. NPDC046928 TaxID=3155021 RepID=UPI0033CA182A